MHGPFVAIKELSFLKAENETFRMFAIKDLVFLWLGECRTNLTLNYFNLKIASRNNFLIPETLAYKRMLFLMHVLHIQAKYMHEKNISL